VCEQLHEAFPERFPLSDRLAKLVAAGKPGVYLPDFTLDPDWRQIGHRITTVRWQRGRMIPVVVEADQRVT